ncbi:phage integrase family protein [Fimbriiglobus ruber]|uniref:Phage integrase family protein n=1 Tax=Fimbriiglobus ruber TaxID=1908690 RepID=A0A225DE63_9BACT|nr:recombination and DNA repair [Fimbriiglobus ruber]OWK40199.1 phage integrase family protein [Fimbriiglobus ruber]
MTVAQAVEDYLGYLRTEHRARKTLVKYHGIFDRFVTYLAEQRVLRLGQVTAGHFDRYRAHRQKSRHRKTVYTEGVVIKQLFRWARTRKLVTEDVLADVRLHKPPLVPKTAPTLAQVARLLAAADEPLRTYLSFLAFTGMRAGELQRLRLEDIDRTGNWVHVVSRPGHETKTRMSRKIPIHPRLQAILGIIRASGGTWLFTAAPSTKYPDGGRPISVKRLNEQFTRLAARLGLPVGRESGFVVHSLRHFFETAAVNARVPQRVVDAWLGHRSDRSMAAVYYHLGDEESHQFMGSVPFGMGEPAADAGREDAS